MIQLQPLAPQKIAHLDLLIDGVDVDVRGAPDVLSALSSIYRRHRTNEIRDDEMVRGLRVRVTSEQAGAGANARTASERIINGVAGCNGRYMLRAAALERDGRALLIGGLPGSGKSTLAINLLARGWKLLADDFVLLSADATTAIAHQALMTLPARSSPHLPALFRGALEHSRWYTAEGGQDLRFYEVDPALVFGAGVWSNSARLDAIVVLSNSVIDSRVHTIDSDEIHACFEAAALPVPALAPHIRVGVTTPNRAARCAESLEAWFDAHATP